MIWASNYSRLACQTLNTLFWAGKDFAPLCVINGMNIQDYLQSHYINAVKHFATAIAKFEDGTLLDSCVIGWDSLNEPNAGYLSTEDLGVHSKESLLRVGPMPTAFQAMKLGSGQATSVENWKFTSTGPKKDGQVLIDPHGYRAWISSEKDAEASQKWGWKREPSWQLGTCIWAMHGVWNPDSGELLKPDYFHRLPSSRSGEVLNAVNFGQDYWTSHWQEYAKMIRSCHPEAILFVHTPVFAIPPNIADFKELSNRACFSTHFYDGVTLVTKSVYY